jgi:hypothetical protein
MISFKNKYILSIVKNGLTTYLKGISQKSGITIPTLNQLKTYADAKFSIFTEQIQDPYFNNIFTNPPLISKEMFEYALSNVNLYASSLINTPILNDYIRDTIKWNKISQRFLYSNIIANNIVNELSNYSCRHIDIITDADGANVRTFNIGNYVVLPYCVENVKCYNGPISISASTADTVNFENFNNINYLPLNEPVMVKYLASSGTKNIFTLQISMTEFDANVIYINSYGTIESIGLQAYYNNDLVVSDINKSDETLFTFKQSKINTLKLTITLNNYNQNKQASFEISELMVLGNVNFSKQASFETKPIEIKDFFDINKVQINAIDYTNNGSSYFSKYLSLSLTDANTNFFQIDDITSTYIPAAKYTFTKNYIMDGGASTHNLACISFGTQKELKQTFYKFSIASSGINFKQAKVFIGTNDAYGMPNKLPSSADGRIFENWTKIGNYFRTMILNNEENITLDIGLNNKIKINGREVAGTVSIPVGISMVDVHESLFDPVLGSTVASAGENNCLLNDSYIYGDKLYPYNFAYKLAGMPAYLNGDLDVVTLAPTTITDTMAIQLDSPFIPLSISVSGGGTYSLHLGATPTQPGTFTVEPNKGIVRIHSTENNQNKFIDTVIIKYTKASTYIKPCGVLFNRIATYIDYKSIYNMLALLGTFDTTFFSYYKDDTEAILIPAVDQPVSYLKPYHNKIMYNLFDSKLFVATKFTLYTNDTNISPAIKNIFIQGHK